MILKKKLKRHVCVGYMIPMIQRKMLGFYLLKVDLFVGTMKTTSMNPLRVKLKANPSPSWTMTKTKLKVIHT